MRALVWTIAAAALASCETAPTPPPPLLAQSPTYQWRVEDERIGDLLVSAWRNGEWFDVTIQGRWPADDVRTGEALPSAAVARISRVHAERQADGAWLTLNSINLETISGAWRRDQAFAVSTRYPAQTLEHPEDGGFAYFCIGPRAWCYSVNLAITDDPAAPWRETPIERPSVPPPARGNQITALPPESSGDPALRPHA